MGSRSTNNSLQTAPVYQMAGGESGLGALTAYTSSLEAEEGIPPAFASFIDQRVRTVLAAELSAHSAYSAPAVSTAPLQSTSEGLSSLDSSENNFLTAGTGHSPQGGNADFDVSNVKGNTITSNSELTINSNLPTTVACTVANNQTTTSVCPPTSSCTSKSSTLVLSSEEQKLLEKEGIKLPTDVQLTKDEERALNKVRRKIKNRESAQESRRKKNEYVDGLEKRVKTLKTEVDNLGERNKSLNDQLKELQAQVSSTHPTKAQTGTGLMVLFLVFGLVFFPINNVPGEQKTSVSSYAPASVRSRTLLQVQEEDGEELQDKVNPNFCDYLGAASPRPSQNMPSLGEDTPEVSEMDRKAVVFWLQTIMSCK